MCIGIFTHPCNPTLNSIAIINTHYSANYSNQWLDWACQFGERIMSSANVMQILHPSWRVCQGWEQALSAALHQHGLNYAAAFPTSTNLAAGAKHICSYCRPVPQVLACFHSVYLGPGMVVYTKRMGNGYLGHAGPTGWNQSNSPDWKESFSLDSSYTIISLVN